MSERFRTTVTRLAPFLALLLFAAAVVVLRGELVGARYHRIIGHLHSLSWRTLAKALGLTFLCYAVLTRYDALSMRYVHRRIRASRIALASFIAYSLSQTLGFAIFTGGAVRYRFWSSWGLNPSEIARAIGFAGLTLWLGVVTLAGAAMVADPETAAGPNRLGPGRWWCRASTGPSPPWCSTPCFPRRRSSASPPSSAHSCWPRSPVSRATFRAVSASSTR